MQKSGVRIQISSYNIALHGAKNMLYYPHMPIQYANDDQLGEILFTWDTREYQQHDRGPRWYIVMISLGILLIGYGIFSNNFLFSLIIILASIILYMQSRQEPHDIPLYITDLGVGVASRFYQYGELGEFYLIYEPGVAKTLYIETKSLLRPKLRLPLEDQNPLEIRDALLEVLDENLEKEEEPMADAAIRHWKLH